MSEDSVIHTTFVRSIHEYTRSEAPWRLEAYGKKLFRYLSGGGMSALGRSVKQDEADLKRQRFLTAAAIIGVVWLVLWIV